MILKEYNRLCDVIDTTLHKFFCDDDMIDMIFQELCNDIESQIDIDSVDEYEE